MAADETEADALRRFAAAALGSGCRIEDFSRAFGRKSVTWRINSADGSGFYLKRHEFRQHYVAEVRALNQWVAQLPEGSWWNTPEVVANSDELGAVILTELPGEIIEDSPPPTDELEEAYRSAGRLARALHDADIDLSGEPRVQRYAPADIDRYMAPSRPHLDGSTYEWAVGIVRRPDAWEGLSVVPMHGDFSPRNWIRRRGEPTLGIIDWERSRPGFWVEDVQRMTQDHWVKAPNLRDAFFDGYGRTPTESEWRQANQVSLIGAVGGVAWSRTHGDERFEQLNRVMIERLKKTL